MLGTTVCIRGLILFVLSTNAVLWFDHNDVGLGLQTKLFAIQAENFQKQEQKVHL